MEVKSLAVRVIGERSRTRMRESLALLLKRTSFPCGQVGDENEAPALPVVPVNGRRIRGSTARRSCGSVAAGMKEK